MVSKYSFRCKCGKEFAVNGYWFNQMTMHHWLDYKYLLHYILHHAKKTSRKEALYFAKMTLLWIPLLILQILDAPITFVKLYL